MDHVIAHPPIAAVDFSVLANLDDDPIEGEPDLSSTSTTSAMTSFAYR